MCPPWGTEERGPAGTGPLWRPPVPPLKFTCSPHPSSSLQRRAEPMAVETTQGFSQLSLPWQTRQGEDRSFSGSPKSPTSPQGLTGSLTAPSASAASASVNRSAKPVPQAGYIQLPQTRLCGVLWEFKQEGLKKNKRNVLHSPWSLDP